MGATKGGSMAAVLNASEEQLKEALEVGSKACYVDVANYNSPSQVVITGADEAVKAASEHLLANGVRRVVPLAVSGAFHSKFMENAGNEFAEFISDFELNNAKLPVITNVDAQAAQLMQMILEQKCLNKFIHLYTGHKLFKRWLRKVLIHLLRLDRERFLPV